MVSMLCTECVIQSSTSPRNCQLFHANANSLCRRGFACFMLLLVRRSEGFHPNGILQHLLSVHDGPGPRQVARVVGMLLPSPPPLETSGRRSGQEPISRGFPKVLGPWWEILENGDGGSTKNFRIPSRVSWAQWFALESRFQDFFEISRNSDFLNLGMSKKIKNHNFSDIQDPQGASRHKGAFQKLTSRK